MNFSHHKHIFFDLDHTLWDFEANTRLTLQSLYDDFDLQEHLRVDFRSLERAFHIVLNQLWTQYNHNQITKAEIREKRFRNIAKVLNRPELAFSDEVEEAYWYRGTRQGALIPHTKEVLTALQKHGYRLHVLTNGFQDSQAVKLETSGIAGFFDTVTTSESTGEKKPSSIIFEYALQTAKVTSPKSLLIGDNPETDLLGAKNAGWESIFFNPKNASSQVPFTHQVNSLRELLPLFPKST